ncbi:MAG: putative hydrolase [Microbacteriaceae bacterium]|nr:putative hydrolase [Microbacteriaceae bacterium]HEV7956266.1 HAD family phosphatase [Marisediminicola sp.]
MTELSPTPAAVLWDMDGTLVDTEPYWMLAETELIESFGGSWTHEDALTVIGKGLWDVAVVFQAHGVEMTADEIVEWMTNRVLEQVRANVPWRPGARELLAELKEAKIPTAMVTMSVHRMARMVADSVGFPAFDVIVGGDDVARAEAKPHPAPYLRAAKLLAVDIVDCVAIEDSVPGLASAVASGAVTIGVPLLAKLQPGPTHTLWPSLAGKTLADLVNLLDERRSVRAL